MDSWVKITAKFAGRCSLCSRRFAPGAALMWMGYKTARHIECHADATGKMGQYRAMLAAPASAELAADLPTAGVLVQKVEAPAAVQALIKASQMPANDELSFMAKLKAKLAPVAVTARDGTQYTVDPVTRTRRMVYTAEQIRAASDAAWAWLDEQKAVMA